MGNNVDLNDLIDPNSGWTLKYAYAINEDGWIVGQGFGPGQPQWPCGYLLKPVPEPSALVLLGGAVPALLRRRRS